MKCLQLQLAIVLAFCAGCGTALPKSSTDILDHGDIYQVMLLHRVYGEDRAAATFHSCVVDKSVTIVDPRSRRKLIKAVSSNLKTEGLNPACMFMPRYGVRVTRGGHTFEAVICFTCFQSLTYEDGKNETFYYVKDEGQKEFESLISD